MTRHGWWWHLLNDPIGDNPWAVVALVAVYVAVGGLFVGWDTLQHRYGEKRERQ